MSSSKEILYVQFFVTPKLVIIPSIDKTLTAFQMEGDGP